MLLELLYNVTEKAQPIFTNSMKKTSEYSLFAENGIALPGSEAVWPQCPLRCSPAASDPDIVHAECPARCALLRIKPESPESSRPSRHT
jgi:hypothetical protein